MKNFILNFIFVLFICLSSAGQRLSDIDTGKYTINLPQYWKPGNKVWQILTDKLPTVCDELNDKELCGDNCKPKYTVEFEMSEPVILDYYTNHISSGAISQSWQFVTLYSFSASLLLFNEKDSLLTRFILVDTNEIWTVKHQAELASYLPAPPQKIYVQGPQIFAPMTSALGRAGQSPFAYINSNKEKLAPTQRDMFGVVDEKIRSW